MKKILVILLAITSLLGMGMVNVNAGEKEDVSIAKNIVDYADYFYDGFTVGYVRQFVCDAFVDENSDIYNPVTHTQTYSAEAVDAFMADYFVFTDAMFTEVREVLGYDADRDVYDLPFIGGFGGMVKPREMVSYVKNQDNTYSLYYQTINWIELPTSEYQKMEQADEWPEEVVYNGKTYEATADGYLCKDGYKDGGLVHTLEIHDSIARYISTKPYTGSKVTAATTTATAAPTTGKPAVKTTTGKPATTTGKVVATATTTTAGTTTETVTTTTTALPAPTETVAETEGLVLKTAENVFPEDTIVKAEIVEKDAPVYETVESALKPIATKFVAYEITATKDNVTVQPDGTVTATFNIPADFDAAKTVVLYVADDGTTEELTSTVDANAGTVTAALTHFSTYVVAEKTTTDAVSTDTPDASQPTNGAPWVLIIIIAVVVLAAGIVAWYFLIYKKKQPKAE